MRIAIVGAGISGLATAHLLHRAHEVTVFEAGQTAGGHANTVRVDTEHATHHVDTGFIVFNDRNYPNFERLLASLGVASQPSDMSFGVSDGGDFEYNGSSPNGLFAKRAHLVTPWFHRMVADLVRFNRDARALLAAGGDGPSLGHWLDERAYSRPFVERLIVPQASRRVVGRPAPDVDVPGALPDRVLRQPRHARVREAAAVADGRRRLAVLRRRDRRARGGTGCASNTPIRAIHRYDDHVTVTPRGGEPERFDHVVLAHATPTSRWRCSPTPPTASTRSSARSRTSATRPSCTPTAACCRAAAARGRAGTTTCCPSRPG